MTEPTPDAEDPLDQLNVQLPGRMLAVEIVLVLLLRQKSNVGRLMASADEILTLLETNEFNTGPAATANYALHVFAAARQSLDKLSAEARRR
jgi:hypothetical protein